ncbi:alpha-L-glutamate ligase-like protein [Desulfonatronovibrio hydrogenovorans]|uniref:alpha-L-glutamate ligase-like protein n=1 Tax=Desulfonatronovibrio hydrogenovorans TaxID=53245 RepID=UPI00048B52E7|nr:alpha-L-glutamate ligase-like protein [Desulfonatronovibrio hydrogenovorans]
MIATPGRLKKLGILGMNRRNADFILPFNPRRNYPLVDDKVLTKDLAGQAGLAVPRLFGVVDSNYQLRKLAELLADLDSFVIKPSRGSGGNGILVAQSRQGSHFFKPDGSVLDLNRIKYHAANIISGMYSLGGIMDKAMIEYRVRFDPIFREISFQGVPDIRVIVFKGVPVMSMLRLPTRLSSGRANLHQGAIGVGVDISSGTTLKAVWKNRPITRHPDTAAPLKSITIPCWDEILLNAAQSREIAGLDYLGVDIVLDAELGPLILEFNVRPGLAIQLANGQGLAPRLEKIQSLPAIPEDPEERVVLTRTLFCPDPES